MKEKNMSEKKKMSKKVRIILLIMAFGFGARAVYFGYPLLFPKSPQDVFEDCVYDLEHGDLEDQDEAMEEIMKNLYKLTSNNLDCQEAIINCLNRRYTATIGSKKKYEKHDSGIFTYGLTAIKHFTPFTDETKKFLQTIVDDKDGQDIEHMFGYHASFAAKALGKNMLYETDQKMKEVEKTLEETKAKINNINFKK